MGDMTFAVAPHQWERDAPGANRRIAIACGGEDIAQGLVDLRIVRGKPSAARPQDVARREHGVAGGVGVHNAADGIHEQHAGADAVESVGERIGLGGLEVDDLADQNGAANMGDDQAQAPAHVVIDDAVALVPEDDQCSGAGHGLFEDDVGTVDQTLRLHPFLEKPCCQKFFVGDDIGCRGRLLDLGEEMACSGGVQLDVLVEIRLPIARIDAAVVIVDATTLAGCVLPVERSRRSDDKLPNLAEHVRSQRRLQRRVVDVAD